MMRAKPCYPPRVEWTGGSRRGNASRKVRTLTGSRLANGQARRRDGKCNREQTADRAGIPSASEGTDKEARVKRCGKSAPRPTRVGAARQTPCGARPNREVTEPPV